MQERTHKRARLRVIRGTYPCQVLLGSLKIVAAPEDMPPFPVDAVAFEEDTFLVLSARPQVRETKEPLVRVMTRVIETQPKTPGSVLVKGKRPLRFLAIVHDLNQEPSWREEWVASALDEIFRETKSRRLQSIALPFLGTLHGSLKKQRFLAMLRCALERMSATHLKRVWLIVPARTSSQILHTLESEPQK